MSGNDYQSLAMRTANPEMLSVFNDAISNAALGMNAEAGEVANLLKKSLYQGHPLEKDDFINELGDVLWYVALACTALDVGMDTVMEKNIKKLHDRYPHGFSAVDSIKR